MNRRPRRRPTSRLVAAAAASLGAIATLAQVPETEPNNTLAQADAFPFLLSQSIQASFRDSGGTYSPDYFRFDGFVAGTPYRFDAVHVGCHPIMNRQDIVLQVYDTAGTPQLPLPEDDGGDCFDEGALFVPALGGSYYLCAMEFFSDCCGVPPPASATYLVSVEIVTPTPSPTRSPSLTPSRSATPTRSLSPTASLTRSATPTRSPSLTASRSRSASPTPSPPINAADHWERYE